MATIDEPAPIKQNAKAARRRTERRANGRLGKQARAVTEDLRELGDIAKDVAAEKLEQLRANGAAYVEDGRDQVQQVGRSFEQYVREQPLKSVLIAAGVGLLLGRFWIRR